MSHPYNDAGRGLIAVIIAKQMGLRSIDYCLKKYVPGEVDPSWAELAETLVRGMVQSSSEALNRQFQRFNETVSAAISRPYIHRRKSSWYLLVHALSAPGKTKRLQINGVGD